MTEKTRRKPIPESIDFRAEGRELFGLDRDDGADYRIGWCGNGAYSHYYLKAVEDPERGWYVYVDDKDPLYRAIAAAEMKLIYGVVTT